MIIRTLAVVVVVGALATGCATNGSVKERTDPLAARLTAVESQLAEMNKKVSVQAGDLETAQKNLEEMKAASERAQQASTDAQAAAARAETAADKAAKAFELSQRKGK
jgi:hypothetical protein